MDRVQLSNIYSKVITGFVVLTVILILIILYFALSQATIFITPTQETISVDFLVNIKDQDNIEVDELKGNVIETVVEGSQTFISTGEKAVAEDLTEFTTTLTVYNDYPGNKPLIRRTRFQNANGDLFRLSEATVFPAQSSLEVEVYADDPASLSGDIEPGDWILPALDQASQELIYAKNEQTIKLGGNTVPVVTISDIEKAEIALAENLYEQALDDLVGVYKQNKTDKDDDQVKALLRKITSSIVEDLDHDAKSGDEKTEFTVTIKLKVAGIIFEEDNLFDLAKEKLEINLPDDRELVNIDLNSLTYNVDRYDAQSNEASVRVNLSGNMSLRQNSDVFDKERVIGLSELEVTDYFLGFKSIKNVEVHFSPFWVKRVPKLKDHVDIVIVK